MFNLAGAFLTFISHSLARCRLTFARSRFYRLAFARSRCCRLLRSFTRGCRSILVARIPYPLTVLTCLSCWHSAADFVGKFVIQCIRTKGWELDFASLLPCNSRRRLCVCRGCASPDLTLRRQALCSNLSSPPPLLLLTPTYRCCVEELRVLTRGIKYLVRLVSSSLIVFIELADLTPYLVPTFWG